MFGNGEARCTGEVSINNMRIFMSIVGEESPLRNYVWVGMRMKRRAMIRHKTDQQAQQARRNTSLRIRTKLAMSRFT